MRTDLKFRVLLGLILGGVIFSGCDRDLKEHPMPGAVKKELKKRADPAVRSREITGTVSLDPETAKTFPDHAKLFIIARPQGVEGGPPLAVTRHSLVRFPFEYTIGPAHVMVEGRPFEGPLKITARFDRDGRPGAGTGDLEGVRTAQPGEKQVDIVLDRLVEGEDHSVAGIVEVDPALADQLPPNGIVFIIARKEGAGRGPPLAVKRLTNVQFPLKFSLGQEDTMLPGTVLEGKLKITARLDQDGDARPGPGDIEGVGILNAGDKGAVIILNRVLKG